MARNTGGNCGDVRQSALWGSGNRGGEFRSNALWGKGGRGGIVTLVGVLVLSLAAGAASAKSTAPQPAPSVTATVVEAGLLERAQANPKQMFRVIVQSANGAEAAESAFEDVEKADDQQLQDDEKLAEQNEQLAEQGVSRRARRRRTARRLRPSVTVGVPRVNEAKALRKSARGELDDRFDFIGGVSLEISGRRLEQLARMGGLTITEDVEVQQQVLSGGPSYGRATTRPSSCGPTSRESAHSGRDSVGTMPTIAIVDSGIDTTLPDFAGSRTSRSSTSSARASRTAPRRSRSRHLRCRHRGRLGEGRRRRGTECSAHLARRHGRLRLRPDE